VTAPDGIEVATPKAMMPMPTLGVVLLAVHLVPGNGNGDVIHPILVDPSVFQSGTATSATTRRLSPSTISASTPGSAPNNLLIDLAIVAVDLAVEETEHSLDFALAEHHAKFAAEWPDADADADNDNDDVDDNDDNADNADSATVLTSLRHELNQVSIRLAHDDALIATSLIATSITTSILFWGTSVMSCRGSMWAIEPAKGTIATERTGINSRPNWENLWYLALQEHGEVDGSWENDSSLAITLSRTKISIGLGSTISRG